MSREPLPLDAIDAAWAAEKHPANVQRAMAAARAAIAGARLDGVAMDSCF